MLVRSNGVLTPSLLYEPLSTQSRVFGGGGGGTTDFGTEGDGSGGDGAVRIIWGPEREYPSTHTEQDNYAYNWYYDVGDWVPAFGGYYAGILRTGSESFTNLDPEETLYRIFIAEKSVSQSQGQYKTSQSCDGSHTYPGTTIAEFIMGWIFQYLSERSSKSGDLIRYLIQSRIYHLQ